MVQSLAAVDGACVAGASADSLDAASERLEAVRNGLARVDRALLRRVVHWVAVRPAAVGVSDRADAIIDLELGSELSSMLTCVSASAAGCPAWKVGMRCSHLVEFEM